LSFSFRRVTSAGKRPLRSGRSSGVGTASSSSSKTLAAVSAPPYLGPIAEQKSMEEHEEMELKRQPPSPLQHFIDSIRHSAKAKHAPIYYGTKDLLNGLPGWSSTSNARRSSALPSVFHSLTHSKTIRIPTRYHAVPSRDESRKNRENGLTEASRNTGGD